MTKPSLQPLFEEEVKAYLKQHGPCTAYRIVKDLAIVGTSGRRYLRNMVQAGKLSSRQGHRTAVIYSLPEDKTVIDRSAKMVSRGPTKARSC